MQYFINAVDVQSDGSAMFRKLLSTVPGDASSILLTRSDNSSETRQLQSETILKPIVTTRGGTRRFCTAVSRNAISPISSTVSGRFNVHNLSQF